MGRSRIRGIDSVRRGDYGVLPFSLFSNGSFKLLLVCSYSTTVNRECVYVKGAGGIPPDPDKLHLDEGKCCSSLESPVLELDARTRWGIGLIPRGWGKQVLSSLWEEGY